MATINSKEIVRRLQNYTLSTEPALVVGWFDVFRLLLFALLCFVCLAPLFDGMYTFYHSLPAGQLTDNDMKNQDNVYGLWRYILLVAAGVVVFFIINYANFKKDGGD